MPDPKLLGLLTAVFFGLVPVVLKLGFQRGGTTGIAMIIGLAVAVPANLLVLLFVRPDLAALTPFAVATFALAGLVGSGVGRRWSYNAIQIIGPSRTSTLWTTSPVFTALMAAIIYAEPVTPARWGAIAAIAIGGALVTWTPGATRRGWLSIGVIYALGASFVFGLRPLFLKAGLLDAELPVVASTIGAATALTFALVMENVSTIRVRRIDVAVALFLFAGLLQTASQLALTIGLAGGDVSVVYTLTAVSPLLTIGFTAVLLRGVDEITPRLVLGALLTVAGVIVL